MFSFNFKFDRQLNVSNQIHQKESWKSVDVVLGSIKRLKLTAQGMEQRTNVQSQVWYHSAVHIVNFNMSKELKIQISQTCLQMDGGCQCSVGDNISKSCLWVFVFKLKSLKCVFYLSLSLSYLFQNGQDPASISFISAIFKQKTQFLHFCDKCTSWVSCISSPKAPANYISFLCTISILKKIFGNESLGCRYRCRYF